jgi:hypothetical protein
MDATGPTKMLLPIYQTTQRHIPEDHYLNIHHCENLNKGQ